MVRTVFLIDDHPIVALGLRIALKASTTLAFAGSATDPATGIYSLERLKPHCLILDLVFEGGVAEAVVESCRDALPTASIVVFSSLPARLYEQSCLEAGADAFLGKNADHAELLALLDGIAPDSSGMGRKEGGRRAPAAAPSLTIEGIHMTPREAQVASRLGNGASIAAIAEEFGMSPNTVAVHRDNIRRKLCCRDTKDLVARLARLDRPYKRLSGETAS